MKKKIKCWVEIYQANKKEAPTIWRHKPSPNELANSHDFGYKMYEGEIALGKELSR